MRDPAPATLDLLRRAAGAEEHRRSVHVRPSALLGLLVVAATACAPGATEGERTLADLLARPAPLPDWEPASKASRRPGPTRAEEALRAFEEHPEHVGRFVRDLPPTPATVSRVAEAYEVERRSPTWPAEQVERVHLWLMAHSPAFESELRAVAATGPHATGAFGVGGEAPLEILARRDWAAAAAILDRLATGPDPAVRIYATARLYAEADGEARDRLRARLRTAAEDRDATAYERVTALATLSASRWDGDTAWILALFHDETLRTLQADRVHYRPLVSIVGKDPDAWIPRVVPLVGGADRAAHDNAVQCLVQFCRKPVRMDAVRPLLPWIADRGWSLADDRLRLLQSLEGIATEAEIPALIGALDGAGTFEIKAVAGELARLHAKTAAPALRVALDRALAQRAALGDPDSLFDDPEADLLRALLVTGGMDVDEQVRHVEAYVTAGERGSTPSALLGRLLVRQGSSDLMEGLLVRAAALEAATPGRAASLRAIVERSATRAATEHLLRRLLDGTIDADGVEALLEARDDVRAMGDSTPEALGRAGGFAGGVAAVLTGDSARMRAVLEGDDSLARRAVLACARLVRESLPFDDVVPLLDSKDSALAWAADRFLEGEDSAQARAVLRARAPHGARIVGLRPGDPDGYANEVFARREEGFRQEVLADGGPDDVFALLSTGTWGGRDQWVVRRRGSDAHVTLEPVEGAATTWALAPATAVAFLGTLRSEGADDLPAYDPSICDGIQYEYVRVARDGGVRVFMNNPGPFDPEQERWSDAYSRLVRAFDDLRRSRPR